MIRSETLENGVFRRMLVVPPDAVDRNGHVNNVRYVEWMQDVAIRHSEISGGTAAMNSSGGTWVVRSHRIMYLSPAFSGDLVEVATWVAAFGRVKSFRRYRFTRIPDGRLLAQGETEWVFLDAHSGRPVTIPETVRSCFPVIEVAEP
ncbi:MAG: acyl-CoA thioesterase [Bacteroidota bacterium]|nr:acyl-CoA thioesterase [Bacteroidota bacterium]